jgi:hypothetical protein
MAPIEGLLLASLGLSMAMARKAGLRHEELLEAIRLSREMMSSLPDIERVKPDVFPIVRKIIDLTFARENEPWEVTGSVLAVESLSDGASLNVKLNDKGQESMPLDKWRAVNVPFDKVYLTNTAQPGKAAVLVVGSFRDFSAEVATLQINIQSQSLTLDISVGAATVMMPVDVQGAFIMIPVDIQGQFVDLDINIVASEVTLDINIASSDATLNINVESQTADLDINIQAQNVGIFLKPDWETVQGNWKSLSYQLTSIASGCASYFEYTVPAGKTLFITHFTAQGQADDPADFDKPEYMRVTIWNWDDAITWANQGGDAGAGLAFPTPAKITAGKTLRCVGGNYSSHGMHISICVTGYEVTV